MSMNMSLSLRNITKTSVNAHKKNLRGMILFWVGLGILFSVSQEIKYARLVTTAGELGNIHHAIITQQQQKDYHPTQTKFIPHTPTTTRIRTNVKTTKLKHVEHNGTGSQAKVSVGQLKDSLSNVMEQVEMEAIASTGTLSHSDTIQGAPSSMASNSVRPKDPNSATGTKSVAASGVRPDGLKIAFYMTTHVSKEHLKYIDKCWPAAMERLDILKNVDLIVYTSSRDHDHIFQNMGFHHVTIYRYNEPIAPANMNQNADFPQKQKGALTAMVDPWLVNPSAPESDWVVANTSWFDDYDWVIRLNPDVMIRDDQWLLQQMRNTSIQGIFVKWHLKYRGIWLHTDFSAFRPKAIDYHALIQEYLRQTEIQKYWAEQHFTAGFRRMIDTQISQIAFLPKVKKGRGYPGIGRVSGYESPVIHVHDFIKHCPNYFDAHAKDKKYY